jgi:hypothetical protein
LLLYLLKYICLFLFKGMVRILDASNHGNHHAVIYDCQMVQEDGTCHPDYTSVDILSRTTEPFNEESRLHLRAVIRQACLEPGDFADANHDGRRNCFVKLN